MMGLPHAGKTTFLAAMWHVLCSDEVNGALKLERLTGDREYLNTISGQWSAGIELERTTGEGKDVCIEIKNPKTEAIADLHIPDPSGETFELHWETRECSSAYATLAAETSGVMLFVHPDHVKETDSLFHANAVVASFAPEAHRAVSEPKTPEKWDPRKVPTQVKLVELLQFLCVHACGPHRVAIIVSAWDRAPVGTTPAQWLEKRLPLLDQFLKSNADVFSIGVFGISAQGGVLKHQEATPEQHAATMAPANPSDRIKVVFDEDAGNDITLPIRWLMAFEAIAGNESGK